LTGEFQFLDFIKLYIL